MAELLWAAGWLVLGLAAPEAIRNVRDMMRPRAKPGWWRKTKP